MRRICVLLQKGVLTGIMLLPLAVIGGNAYSVNVSGLVYVPPAGALILGEKDVWADNMSMNMQMDSPYSANFQLNADVFNHGKVRFVKRRGNMGNGGACYDVFVTDVVDSSGNGCLVPAALTIGWVYPRAAGNSGGNLAQMRVQLPHQLDLISKNNANNHITISGLGMSLDTAASSMKLSRVTGDGYQLVHRPGNLAGGQQVNAKLKIGGSPTSIVHFNDDKKPSSGSYTGSLSVVLKIEYLG